MARRRAQGWRIEFSQTFLQGLDATQVQHLLSGKAWSTSDGKGKPETITSDPAQCIPKSDIIIIAGVPIHHNPALLRQIKPHLPTNKKVFIGSICAYGGFDWVANRELGE